MKNIFLNFFGEEISIKIPTDLASLRKEISDKFMFSPSDAAEVVITYMKDLGKKIIQTEQDFSNFVSNKIGKIDLDISPNSKLFLKNFDSLQKESEEAKKELELCLKKKEEIKRAKEACLKEESAKIEEIERQLKDLIKKKKTLKNKLEQDKKKFVKEENENNIKIAELEKKLGIKEKKEKEAEKENKKVKISPKKTILKARKEPKVRPIKKTIKKKEVHSLVTCDGCKMNPLIGKRYKCQCCPNFDFCEECYKNKKEKHGHSFKLVETKMILNQIIKKFSIKTENSEGKAIHHMFSCDGCGMSPIIGTRFRCNVCNNFDYCENCKEIYKNQHNHPFIKVERPNMK